MLGRRVLVAALAASWARGLTPAWQARRSQRSTQAQATVESEVATVEPWMRVGHGYDIHRMASRDEAGQPVVISGVKFDGTDAPDFELGCVAHSDGASNSPIVERSPRAGDVVYHSVVDAILGALTLPDIGQLFPDNDPRLRGADSEIFMEEAYSRMDERGYAVGNCDVTLICQKPRVNVDFGGASVKQRMRDNLARLLRVPLGCVNVKARTHEKVDSVGECRALECHVVIYLQKKGVVMVPQAGT